MGYASEFERLLIGVVSTSAGLALTFAAAAAVGSHLINSDTTGSDVLWEAQHRMQKAETLFINSHEQYLVGLHSGMITTGVEISQETNDRMVPFIQKDPVLSKRTGADDLALFEIRALGAIAGTQGHSEADLVNYLDYVEGLSENLAETRVAHEKMFNGLSGISSGDRLAKIAQSVAFLADDMFEDVTAREAVDSILKSAFDEGYEPSQDDLNQLRNAMDQATAESARIASTEDILISAKETLVSRNMGALSETIKAEDVIVACPFGLGDKTPTDAEQLLTSDDACEPGK